MSNSCLAPALSPDDKVKGHQVSQFLLQNVSREILCKSKYDFRETIPALFGCHRFLVKFPVEKSNVEVNQNIESKKVFYSQLQTCKSVWVCPVCSSKISNQRQKNLEKSLNSWSNRCSCHQSALVTFTFPHNRNQSLSVVRNMFMSARRRMKNQKKLKKNISFESYQEIIENYGIVGEVASIEINFSQANGWHVHCHVIYFLAWKLRKSEKLRVALVEAWKRALVAEKCIIDNDYAFFQHSVDVERVRDEQVASYYIAKIGTWSISKEVTQNMHKQGLQGSLTSWDFLRNIFSGVNVKYYKKLFVEFAKEFKGKRQIFFSKGMAKFLNYDDSDDDFEDFPAEFLGSLDQITWRKICKLKKRGEFLELCEHEGFQKAYDFYVFNKAKDKDTCITLKEYMANKKRL